MLGSVLLIFRYIDHVTETYHENLGPYRKKRIWVQDSIPDGVHDSSLNLSYQILSSSLMEAEKKLAPKLFRDILTEISKSIDSFMLNMLADGKKKI